MPDPRELFFEVHSGLPREGPGDDASTARALALAADLPSTPRVLDVGCGPGLQTLTLARLTGGSVKAVDLHGPFLKELAARAAAAGLADRIETVRASMSELPFEPDSFDLIWSEGAIYIMGFEAGLKAWRPLLAKGGYIAVTEPCFLTPDPPAEVRDFWTDYPDMKSPEQRLAQIAAAGLTALGHFTIPDSAWWDDYYTPMTARLRQVQARYRDDPAALAALVQHDREIELRRRFADHYGYVFFVMREAAD